MNYGRNLSSDRLVRVMALISYQGTIEQSERRAVVDTMHVPLTNDFDTGRAHRP